MLFPYRPHIICASLIVPGRLFRRISYCADAHTGRGHVAFSRARHYQVLIRLGTHLVHEDVGQVHRH